MGSDQKVNTGPVVKIPTAAEIKTYIMIAQNRINLFRNKKLEIIKKKKLEIIGSLKENNLDVAKAKMDSLIREEDYITAYDILVPLLEILKERVTYIITSTECPPELRAQLDSVIFASTRIECEELYKLRDLIMLKYGSAYIQKADANADQLVNVNLVEKLRVKPASDAFLLIRLKQLCKEKKFAYEFPTEIISDIPGDMGGDPFGAPGNNPYAGDFNPYASTQQGNNPYAPPQGTNGPNPYGPQNDMNMNNNNPYNAFDNNNSNPYASNNSNPYGNNNMQNNPYGNNNMQNNPFENNNNQNNGNDGGNPYQ